MKLLAADCGGTRIKLGLVEDRSVVAMAVFDACSGGPLAARLAVIGERFEALGRREGWRVAGCDGIVLALPVIVSPAGGAITATFGKFDDALDFDLAGWAAGRLGLPLVLENDARAAAIGEWTCGAGRGVENMVMVTLGTGIGTGVICEGVPLRGRGGMAGILGGHSVTHLGGATCPCGAEGCLEAQIASWAMPGHARRHPDFSASPLAREPVLDYRTVFRQAEAGNSLAREIRERALKGWGALMINLIHGYDPERIVIGGGIMGHAEVILPELRAIVDRQATQPGGTVEIVPAGLGDSAALLGAPWLWEHIPKKAPEA